ncbi:MAG: GGDEF domain-containing protein [Spirochaetota bacterium]
MIRVASGYEPQRLTLVLPYGIAVAGLLVLIIFSQRIPGDAIRLDRGWQYTWDDITAEEVVAGVGSWNDIDYPSNPPGRDGRSFVWFRRELPRVPVVDPHVFVFSIDTAARAYVDGRPVYRWNDWTAEEPPAFAGWPPNVIELPDDYEGRTLSVRVASDYRDIGLWGTIFLGSERTIYKSILVRDLPLLAIVVVCIAAVVIMTALVRPHPSWSGVALGVLLAALAVAVMSGGFSSVVLLDDPFFWFVVETNAYVGVVGIAALVIRGMVARPLRVWTTVYLAFVVVTAIAANGGTALGLLELHNFIPAIDALTVVGVVLVSALLITRRVEAGEHRFLASNFAIMGALFSVSLLVSYGAIPWVDNVVALVVLQFVAGLVYEFLRQYRFVVVQLEGMATTMEERIDERTRVLAEINRTLAREREFFAEESRHDPLTGLYNRAYVDRFLGRLLDPDAAPPAALCVAMVDLDHFKRVNDTQGHQAGDEALRRVADTLQENLRGSEVLGRYGGEEFIIVFPDTTESQALGIAERVRSALERTEAASATPLTASIGVACYDGQSAARLIGDADRALYAAKRAGRNRVERA